MFGTRFDHTFATGGALQQLLVKDKLHEAYLSLLDIEELGALEAPEFIPAGSAIRFNASVCVTQTTRDR